MQWRCGGRLNVKTHPHFDLQQTHTRTILCNPSPTTPNSGHDLSNKTDLRKCRKNNLELAPHPQSLSSAQLTGCLSLS
ncbi:hypothetical protein J0904_02035 [Acinetobacter bereziniae]|uniref:hypothetical protein n=1 Tax=Acinetobacter bereziniae TaxID=106648 RepID=UPI002075420D|nr:hypothetical protein [Acinetobacter bereziniae]MCM8510868.1 hypothetical protein [Acinetobacter bereziniae]